MSARSKIEWTDSTFNPWIGCTRVGPGCDHCYAEAMMDTRRHVVEWGAGKPRKRTSPDYWKQPLRWNAKPFFECGRCGWRGELQRGESDVGPCPGCLHIGIEPARRRVFCASLADVFDNEVDPAWRHDLFSLIRDTPNLDWLLLTKRIGNAAKMIDETLGILPPNAWLGATVVNQAEADRDIPKLLATPAAKRFLSCEPLLGPIHLTRVGCLSGWLDVLNGWRDIQRASRDDAQWIENRIDWVIAGGESGPLARPMHPDWARSLRDQCARAGVPFLFKQWGEFLPGGTDFDGRYHTWEPDDEHEPQALDYSRVTVVEQDGVDFGRVGKKKAERTLDGREHNAFPESA